MFQGAMPFTPWRRGQQRQEEQPAARRQEPVRDWILPTAAEYAAERPHPSTTQRHPGTLPMLRPLSWVDDLVKPAARLCRECCPNELPSGIKLYLLPDSQLPASFACWPNAYGYTQAEGSLTERIRPFFGDEWPGPGHTVVFNDRRILANRLTALSEVAMTSLHELAHTFSDVPGQVRALFGLSAAEQHRGIHDPRWARTLMHLFHRATAIHRCDQRGITMSLSALFGYAWDTGRLAAAYERLQGECHVLSDQPFATILDHFPAPEGFVRLVLC